MKSFAIVLVCYNRLKGLKRLVESLMKVDFNNRHDITLIFSIDNSGTDIVEKYAKKIEWPYGDKIIRTFPKRQGLKNHILSCGDFTEKYDIISILEDDLMVSNSFYNYAYQSANYYFDDDNIAGISLYGFQKNWLDWVLRFEPQKTIYDAYFMKIAQSWGQIWTKSKWQDFRKWYLDNIDFTKSNDIPEYLNTWPESSWLKYHDRYCIENNKYFVYPYVSISTNFSDSGEHSLKTVTDHQVELMYDKKEYRFCKFERKSVIYDEYMNRENLGIYLGIEDKDLCVDFWGTKKNHQGKRYLLTLEGKNYKVVKEYALALRPIELSIIENIKGSGIYLYDCTIKAKKPKVDGKYNRMQYSFRSNESNKILKFAVKHRIKDIVSKVRNKRKKIIKKKKK